MNSPFEIRQNMTELQECFESIREWERQVKGKKEKEPLKVSKISKKENLNANKQRIKSSDYSAWDKFDVDQAIEEVDNQERDRLNQERANEFKEQVYLFPTCEITVVGK